MNENNLLVVKFETIKVPAFKEVKGKDWVYFGDDNLYPDYLISLYERSATHGAIINGKVQYILGEGITYDNRGITIENKARIQNFLIGINPDEDIEELLNKVALDFELFNGFYLEIIPTKNGKDFTVNHIPFNKMRTNADMSKFYYSNDWQWEKGNDPVKTGFKEFNAFNPEQLEHSIYYFKILSPKAGKSANVYPIPTYIGGTQSIETEIECSNFNLSEIKTGFSAGTMINFNNGIPTPEDRKAIKKQIRDELTGSEGTGFILSFSDNKDRSSEVLPLNGNDLPDRYMNVKNSAMKTIFTAHRVSSPSLFGVQQENVTFGTRAEIAEQYEIFQNTYVSGRQKYLEKVFNNFAKLKGINPKIRIKPTKAINTDIFSEQVIIDNLPKQAIQEIIAARMGIDLSKYQTVKIAMNSELSEDEFEKSFLEKLQGVSKSDYELFIQRPFAFDELDNFNFEQEIVGTVEPKSNTTTPPPTKVIKTIPAELRPKVEVLYSYEWREGFSNADLDTSREFCRELIRRDQYYTKDMINRMKNEFDSSVWKYKGGWYTRPDGSHVPYCRHQWVANLVIKK